MKTTIIVAALLLSGCATGTFTTRAAMTLDGTKVLACSQYGVLPCVGTELDQRDAAAIIEAMRARAAMDLLLKIQQAPVKPTGNAI